jgi:hypothetical protein
MIDDCLLNRGKVTAGGRRGTLAGLREGCAGSRGHFGGISWAQSRLAGALWRHLVGTARARRDTLAGIGALGAGSPEGFGGQLRALRGFPGAFWLTFRGDAGAVGPGLVWAATLR